MYMLVHTIRHLVGTALARAIDWVRVQLMSTVKLDRMQDAPYFTSAQAPTKPQASVRDLPMLAGETRAGRWDGTDELGLRAAQPVMAGAGVREFVYGRYNRYESRVYGWQRGACALGEEDDP